MKRLKFASRKTIFAVVLTCGPKIAHVAGKGFVLIRHHLETVSILHEVITIPLEWEGKR